MSGMHSHSNINTQLKDDILFVDIYWTLYSNWPKRMYSRNQNIKARFIVSHAFDQENFISFSWFDLQYKRSDYVTTYY